VHNRGEIKLLGRVVVKTLNMVGMMRNRRLAKTSVYAGKP